METPLLAAALIVKDEEDTLGDCLASLNALRPLLSEICVYDTGSTDRTVEIAEAAGARVQRGYWDDDFARARNAALAMCNGKWVLSIDADERLDADQAKLTTTLSTALTHRMVGVDTLSITIDNETPRGEMISTFVAGRLLRKSRVHWSGRVHEHAIPRSDRKPQTSQSVDRAIVRLRHIGYALRRVESKGIRNLELADAEVLEYASAKDVIGLTKALVNRARSLMQVGDVTAALEDYLMCWRLDTDQVQRLWAGQDLGDVLVHIGAYDDAAVIARELQADGRAAEFADWVMARARLGQGRAREAWEHICRVDLAKRTSGFTAGSAPILHVRMKAAALAGEVDDAFACCSRLMAGHGQVTGLGPLLVSLWGDRPAHVLAQLLAEMGSEHLPAIADELKGVNGAESVVAHLDALLPVS